MRTRVWSRLVLALGFAASLSAASVAEAHTPAPTHMAELQEGRARFEVVLPSGQAYVEVFIRQNGIQNTAQAIQGSELPLADKPGYSLYSFERGGFHAGDHIEYRFYSYLPNSPGVFTPGVQEFVWLTHTYRGCEEFFATTDGGHCLDQIVSADGSVSELSVYYNSDHELLVFDDEGAFALKPAGLSGLYTPALFDEASMVGVYVKTCGTAEWVPIEETPYALYAYGEGVDPDHYYWYTPFQDTTPIAGGQVREAFACGGPDVEIGDETLRLSGLVEFAYVVEHRGN